MKRDDAVVVLNKLKPELIKRFGIKQLSLFGSTARDEAIRTAILIFWCRLTVWQLRSGISVSNFIWKIT